MGSEGGHAKESVGSLKDDETLGMSRNKHPGSKGRAIDLWVVGQGPTCTS